MLKRRINADRIDMLLDAKKKDENYLAFSFYIKRKQILTNETDTKQRNKWAQRGKFCCWKIKNNKMHLVIT